MTPFPHAPDVPPSRSNEDGAILLLALIFILLISVSILGLLTFGGGGFTDAANLQVQRTLEYAADSATTAAIQNVRYSANAFTNANCLPASPMNIPEDNVSIPMTVTCTVTPDSAPTPQQYTRSATFYACQGTVCSQANAIVTATVEFQDLSPTSGVDDCYSDPYDNQTDTDTCGTGMVIVSWFVQNSET